MKNSSPTSPSISSEEAEALLAPYAGTIAQCFEDAWRNWCSLRDDPRGFGVPLNKRTRAGIVNDHIWQAARTHFSNAKETYFSESKGMLILCIANRLTLRFKKFDKHLRSSNIATVQQEAVAMQLSFDGLSPLNLLTVGYVLDKLETAIEKVVVTLMKNKSIEWSFEISKSVPTVVIMQHSVPLEAPARTRKVKLRKTAQGYRLRVENE